jgi:outer membrane protein assembly factor BamB
MEFQEDNYLYLGTNGRVAALDISDGTIIWQVYLQTDGIMSSTTGEDVNILYKEGMVYAGCNGYLFCIDGYSGEIIWHNGLKGFGFNDIVLAMDGVSVQMGKKVVKHGS